LLSAEQRNALSATILDAIHTAITSKFGENVYEIIMSNLHSKFDHEGLDVVSHSKEFEQVLQNIFGTGIASQLMQRAILNELAHRFAVLDSDFFDGPGSSEGRTVSKAIGLILRNAD
jgi:hypothetical protein